MKPTRTICRVLLLQALLLIALGGALPATAHAQLFALGNRVWLDTDNSSTINGSETGIDGVTVNLFAASNLNAPLATTTTTNGGYYLFNGLAAGDYVVAIAASNFTGVLNGYWSSGTSRTNAGAIVESNAPLANSDIDSDDNGMLQTSGLLSGAVVSSVVTLGPGTEPTGETDLNGGSQGQPDAQANMTVDFGFYTIQLGNLVWNDSDNDGLFNNGEVGYNGVTVQLISADGSALLAATTTSGGGVYAFTGLAAGSYIVRLPAGNFNPGGILRDHRSSIGPFPTLSYEPAPNPNTDKTDSDDNGTESNGLLGLGGYIQSLPIALTAAGQQSFSNANGTTTENRVDFGVNSTPQIDLVVTITDGQSTYTPGATLNYVVVVTNNGPADANGMTVNATRPVQIATWTWTCASGTPASYNCSGSSGNPATFTDSVDLPQLGSITYTVTAQVAAGASGDLVTGVFVVPPVGVSDMTPQDNIRSDIDEGITCPDAFVEAGASASCSVLQIDDGKVNVNDKDETGIGGDACIAQGGSLTVKGGQVVTGKVRLETGAKFKDTSSASFNIVDEGLTGLDNEISDCQDLATVAAGLTCPPGSSINKLSNQTINGTCGRNVYCVKDVDVGDKDIVTLNAPAGCATLPTFIFNVSGKFTIHGGNNGGRIVAGANVLPEQILYNVLGAGPEVALKGGGGGTDAAGNLDCCNASVDGSLVAPGRKINLDAGRVNGAVCSGRDITLNKGSAVCAARFP